MTEKQPDLSDFNNLAIEACDMWQDHLSALASDPVARADLTRLLEPQRRLFADWAAMMQKAASQQNTPPEGGSHDAHSAQPDATAATATVPTGPEPASPEPAPATASPHGPEYGDNALRFAQLAVRVAELERRLALLEGRVA